MSATSRKAVLAGLEWAVAMGVPACLGCGGPVLKGIFVCSLRSRIVPVCIGPAWVAPEDPHYPLALGYCWRCLASPDPSILLPSDIPTSVCSLCGAIYSARAARRVPMEFCPSCWGAPFPTLFRRNMRLFDLRPWPLRGTLALCVLTLSIFWLLLFAQAARSPGPLGLAAMIAASLAVGILSASALMAVEAFRLMLRRARRRHDRA